MKLARETTVTLTEADIREAVCEWVERKLSNYTYNGEPVVVFHGAPGLGAEPLRAVVATTDGFEL